MDDILKMLNDLVQVCQARSITLKNGLAELDAARLEFQQEKARLDKFAAELQEREAVVKPSEQLAALEIETNAKLDDLTRREAALTSAKDAWEAKVRADKAELKKAADKNTSDAAELVVKQNELNRDWAQVKEEKRTMREKILAELSSRV